MKTKALPRRAARTLAAVLTAIAIPLSACSTTQSTQAADNVLTYLEPNTFTTLYPPSAGYYPNGGVLNQITDRLLYQDPESLELSPWIATELPEINQDATEFTFHLREDVTYSDGSPLDAANVVKNFNLFANGDKNRQLTGSEQITNYDYGEVVDDYTVRFHFSAPAPGFAQATSSFNAGLLSNSTLDLGNEGFGPGNATNIIGSGPFTISEEELGTSLSLAAREDYDWAPQESAHQGRAYLDGIRFILAAEESVRVGALVAGQADIARQIEAPEEKHLEEQGLIVSAHSTNGMNNQLAFRFRHPLLQDIRVRQAIIAGVDREEIIRTLFSDSYPLPDSAMAHTALGYKSQGDAYTYDPHKATELLEAAGWHRPADDEDGIRTKDGERLAFTINLSTAQPRSREVITKIQEQLRRIGIDVSLNPGDRATQDTDSLDMNKIQIRHTMVGRADYDVIKSLYHSDNRDSFLNLDTETGKLGDPYLEELLEAVASTPDEEGRKQATGAVQDYLTEQAYILPLFEEPQVYGIQPYVDGFAEEAVGRPWFYNTRINTAALEERS
ncbi:MAG: TIGR04028 family ABC transporter substrate-binding protein [Corynebacterium sp.]|nr:TIGR04028 family ABC transporter substrate-binding protein [Corynebacterium sp.]